MTAQSRVSRTPIPAVFADAAIADEASGTTTAEELRGYTVHLRAENKSSSTRQGRSST